MKTIRFQIEADNNNVFYEDINFGDEVTPSEMNQYLINWILEHGIQIYWTEVSDKEDEKCH